MTQWSIRISVTAGGRWTLAAGERRVLRGDGSWLTLCGVSSGWVGEIRPLASDEVERVATVLGLARLDRDDGVYLVAWEGEEPSGHARLGFTEPPELQDLSVRPEHRRRGVASALLAAVEQEAGRRGFDCIRLQVSADDQPAQALFRARGYADIGIPPQRVRGTIDLRTGPLEVDDVLLTWEKSGLQTRAGP
jgi:[ribosomal protein S18]-alanine N-acetyltransferase